MGLPGMARAMTVSPRSLLPSRAPGGTVRASLVSETKRIARPWRPGHEASSDQAGPLRHLYPGIHRARARSGIQLCSRCKTPRDVDLAALKRPATTFVHDLVGRLVCQKCKSAGKRPAATLLQLT